MSLSEIKEKLYKKEENSAGVSGEHEKSQFDPEIAKAVTEAKKEEDLWKEKQSGLGSAERKLLRRGLMVLGGVLLVILLVVVAFGVRRWVFSEGSASVSISGPNQAKSGRLVTYEIVYKNDNWVNINNAEIRINYPEDFKPEENPNFKEESPTSGSFYIGTVKSHSEGRVVFNGKAYSPKGALIYLRSALSYQPLNYSSRFEAKAQLGINVITAPINVEVQAPQNVSSGDAVDYLVSYRNDGAETMPSFKIRAEYPEGFTFSKSSPAPSEAQNFWYVGSLEPNGSGTIVVSGKLEGDKENTKIVKVSAGMTDGDQFVVLNESSASTKIVSSPFAIAQTVNGLGSFTASPGDTLQFKINYKNDSSIGLRDAIVTAKLEGEVLDYVSLNTNGGSFDPDKKLITWKASDTPLLKNIGPGEGGVIAFSVEVKEIIPVAGEHDKNFVVTSLAKIDSPDVSTPISMNKIIAGNEMTIKVNSKLLLDTSGYYADPMIPNSGPVPPKVGQETTYTLHWKVTNVCNDLSGAKVTANLPTGIEMTGKISPEDARISYNERTNSLVWDIGNLKAGTGITGAPLEAAFQVKVKPSLDRTGKEMDILAESVFSGHDVFTGQDLETKNKGKTTNLIEDKTLGGEGRVVAE